MMNKHLKRGLIAAGSVLAALVLLIFLGPTLFKGKITEIVKHEANEMLVAKLDFQDLNLSLWRHFPHASIELTGLKLTADERFGNEDILSADRVSAVVKLTSLFSDDGIEITKVFIRRPYVNGKKNADGQVNWDIMKPDDEPEAEEVETPEKESAAEEPSGFKLQLKDFRIQDAGIRYADDSSHLYVSTSPVSLTLKGDLSAAQSLLQLELGLKKVNLTSGSAQLVKDVDLGLIAEVAADLENNRFEFKDNRLDINDIELTLDGWAALLEEGMDLDIKAGCEKVRFKDILSLVPAFYTKDFKELTADGGLDLSLWAKGKMVGEQFPAFGLKTEITNGSFKYAALPKAVKDIHLDLKVNNPGGVLDKTVVDIPDFSFTMAGNSLRTSLHAHHLMSDPGAKVSAVGKFDFGAIKDVYPLDEGMSLAGLLTADLKAEGRMSCIEKERWDKLSASGDFAIEGLDVKLPDLPQMRVNKAAASITPQYMNLSTLDARFGKSDLKADGRLSNWMAYLLSGDKIKGELNLKSNLLDLNEFMSSDEGTEEAPAEEKAPASSEEEAAASESAGAIKVPENLDLRLTTVLKEIRLNKMNITNVAGMMTVKNGRLALDGLHLNIFDGTATASGHYSTAEDANRPDVKMALSFKDASFKKTFEELEMVQKMIPIFEKTGGSYALKADIHTRLDRNMSPELMTMTANGEISSEKIDLQKITVFEKLADALNNDKLRHIQAKDIRISFHIKDGRIITKPFDLKMGSINIRFNGSTGLDQSIDYVATAQLPQTGKSLIQNIPITIKGTFSAPVIGVDMKSVADEAVNNIVEDAKEKAKEAIGNKLEEAGVKLPANDIESKVARIRENAKKAGDKLIEEAEKAKAKMYEKADGQGKFQAALTRKAGDQLVVEARKQAAKLMQEAETKIEKLKAGETAE